MKVIHLPLNASQMSILCKGLRENGVDAKACNFIYHPFGFQDPEDICLHLEKIQKKEKKKQIIKDFFKQAIKDFDIFHFHFTDLSVFPSQSILESLKNAKKK